MPFRYSPFLTGPHGLAPFAQACQARFRMHGSINPILRSIVLLGVVTVGLGACSGASQDEELPNKLLRTQANRISDALTFPGVTRIQGLPQVQSPGLATRPRLESIESPFTLVAGEPFQILLVIAQQDVQSVRGAVLLVDHADRYLDLPIEIDPITDEALLLGQLAQDPALFGAVSNAQLGLYGDSGPIGNPVPIPINVTDQAGPLSFQLMTLAAHVHRVTCLAFAGQSPNVQLVSGSDDRSIAIWNISEERLDKRLEGHLGRVLSVTARADGSTLVSGGQDNSVLVFDTDSGEIEQTHTEHTDFVQSVLLSPDEAWLVSGSWDAKIIVRAMESGELLRTLSPGDRVNDLAFSPDGKLLAAGLGTLVGPGSLVIYKSDDWSEHLRLDLPGRVTAVAFAPDGALVALARDRGVVQVLDPDDGWVRQTFTDRSKDTFSDLKFSPTSPQQLLGVTLNGALLGWDVLTGQTLIRVHTDRAYTSADFSPDGRLLALGKFPEGAIRLIKLADLGF